MPLSHPSLEKRFTRPGPGERETTWEIAVDFSGVPLKRAGEISIEATIHDVEARKGRGAELAALDSLVKTSETSIWVLFPEDHPYRDQHLTRCPIDDPSSFQEVDTLYTIDHPRGSIIAWSIIEPDIKFSFKYKLISKLNKYVFINTRDFVSSLIV